jgi:hypothetical protein
MKAEPSLSNMKEQELKKTVMPFAQMRMKETSLLGPDVRLLPVPAWTNFACLDTYLSFRAITQIYHVSFTTYHVLTPDEQVTNKCTLQ